ncbi:hypothetical protein L915_10173 [Phytophthora nicotianae]|uniref:Uncharacterized protein n=1 Tax=Phytophthora nicotianae TaxID=4792 RepID=W2GRI9_PHYNI|nr:hypothetical protein L915_10173 [Phytophthora nicotianae]
MAHSRKKKRELSPTSSPKYRPSTPSNTTATRSAANDPSVMLPVVGSNTLVQPASISAAVGSTFPVSSGDNPFAAYTKTYDFANMIPHICLTPGGVSATAVAADDSACLNLVDEMKEFVDKMVEETDNGATQIWDEVYNKFYLESNRVVRGLSKR